VTPDVDGTHSPEEASSLEGLLENLGRDVIQVVAAPAGLDVFVGEPVIYDPAERSAISRGAVVLGVGLRAGTAGGDGRTSRTWCATAGRTASPSSPCRRR
jgi:hypothetical protein